LAGRRITDLELATQLEAGHGIAAISKTSGVPERTLRRRASDLDVINLRYALREEAIEQVTVLLGAMAGDALACVHDAIKAGDVQAALGLLRLGAQWNEKGKVLRQMGQEIAALNQKLAEFDRRWDAWKATHSEEQQP
jgi:hypothetical protein